MKRLAAYTAVIVATLALLFLVAYFRIVVSLFVISLFVAAAVRPVIVHLTKRGVPLAVAMILTYLAGLSLVGLWLYIVSSSMIDEIQALVNELALTYERTYPVWQAGRAWQQALATRLPPPNRLYEAIAAEEGTLLAQTLFSVIRTIVTVLGSIAVVLVLSIYWSLDRLHFERLWLSLLPADRRVRAREIWRAIEEGVGGYILSEAVQAFLAALFLAVGYILLQLEYPTLLALIGAIAWLIPIIGFIFAVIPALVVGLSTSFATGVIAAIFTVAVFLALEFLVEPRLFSRRQLYSSFFVVLLMIPMANTYGIFGLIAASPLAVAIEILLVKLFSQRKVEMEAVYPEVRIVALEEELAEVRARTQQRADELSPEFENLLQRLTALLKRADEALEREAAARRLPIERSPERE